jgi:signal transduction histidine kinase
LFNPSSIDIGKLCKQLIEEVKLLGTHQHKIYFSQKGDCERCYLDITLVRQILINLLTNAIKYSPDGGWVKLHLSCGNGKVMFQVEDQGIGIPSQDRTKIFDTFHRGINVDTIQGTGLGLAIVKKAVDLHGGEIRFKTKMGIGTMFIVKLPC